MFRPYLVVLLCCFCYAGIAQNDLGVHMIPGYYQTGVTNPAQMPTNRITIGLPSGYLNYFHTAGSINDLIVNREGKEVLEVNRLIDRADTDNRFQTGLDLSTLSFAYSTERWALSFHHAIRAHNFIRYPKTLPQLFWQGNAQFIGETVEFGPDQQSFGYSEMGLGFTANFKRLSVGVRAKFLTGIADISSPRTQASLFTDPDIYQITLNTDYRFNTSSLDADLLVLDSLDQLSIGIGEDRLAVDQWFKNNPGYAIDLGIQFQPVKQLWIGVAVENIGQIRWKDNVTNYVSQGSQEFAGFIIDDILGDPELSFDEARDSVLDLFDFTETSEAYETDLPWGLRITGQWQFNDRWTFGGVYYREEWRNETYQAVALNAYAQIIDRLGAGLSYSIRNERFDNLGVQAVLNLGPLRIMAAADNLPTIIQPFEAEHINGRVGLQLLL